MRFLLFGFVVGLMLSTTFACGQPMAQKSCGPASCQGCCTETGDCLAGTAVFECGSGGAACVACEANQVCQAGACALFPNGDYDASFPDRPDASVNLDAGVFMPGDGGTMMDAGTMDAGPQMVSYSAQIQPIWDSRCDACHQWGYDNIVGMNSRIVAGNLNASTIYTRCLSGDMPRGSSPLTTTQLNLIRDWILNGAPRN
ncbi:MAG: hypothetical protein ACOZQL_24790 [Myxococcota bacterium]